MSRLHSDSPGKTPRPLLPHPSLAEPLIPSALPPSSRGTDGIARSDDILDVSVQPTDDTPTIISRNTPRPATVEEQASNIRGQKLAHFELIEPIGVGGMAAVLRARDTQLDRLVALKILPPEMAADPENVRRFHQEARSAAKLDHENIARVFFCGEDQRLHFIAFEFVEGENLRTVLERRGQLPVGEALHYMLQVAAGLAHAGQRGVVHRDIKPSNIIITPTGRAKLVDMGLARSMEPQNDAGLTQSGVTLGTFDYISPEQALEPRDADIRSDIYSLGCTFYHCLTGRPPVPEGTAAKKLHHHQHVKPLDPRQLVDDLPDEVALILDRMMAKNARDRYQSPEQLVQVLLQAARNLGATPDVPEGVLSVEAALPASPTGRPILLAAFAAIAVVGLIFLLDRTPSPRRPKPIPGPVTASAPGEKTQVVSPVGPASTSPPEKLPPTQEKVERKVAIYPTPKEPSVRDLVDWAYKNSDADELVIRLSGKLDLSVLGSGAEQGLVLRARKQVSIRPDLSGSRPTIRFRYDGEANAKKGPRVALTVLAPLVVIEGVTFVIDGRFSHDTEMVGLLLQGGTHSVTRCEFIQAQADLNKPITGSASAEKQSEGRLISLLVKPDSIKADRARSEVSVSECMFLGFGKLDPQPSGVDGQPDEWVIRGSETGGQDAIGGQGPVHLQVENCAFGPHASVFRAVPGKRSSEPESCKVAMHNCSVLAGRRSAVFAVPEEASAELEMKNSVVSQLELGPDTEEEGAVLIRQATGTSQVSFTGTDNRYHNLDGYWSVGAAWQKAGWGEFRKRVADESRVLLRSPWKLEPRKQLELLEREFSGKRSQAFQLNADWICVRERSRATGNLVGVQRLLGSEVVPDPLPEVDEAVDKMGGRVLVVENAANDSSNGVYPTLNAAIPDARPGDTIMIRQNGDIGVSPIRLDKKILGDLTIRPWRTFQPVLTLATSERDVALFRVHNGKLRLEGLQFLLKPYEEEPRVLQPQVQTVVALEGDGECFLKGCVATLDRNRREANFALATLAPAGRLMKGDMLPTRTADQGPRLALDNCFIRGEGDVLWSRTSRPCEFSVRNSVAALKGSFLNVEVGLNAPVPPPGQKVSLTLSAVTTYLDKHLIRLGIGKELKGLVPLQCKASNCLFMPAGVAQALIHLDAPEIGEKALREKFDWKGVQNGYGPFSVFLDYRPPGDEMAPPSMNPEKWKNYTSEESSKVGLKLSDWPDAELPFTRMEPEQCKSPEDKMGANVNLLPKPTATRE